jgi:quercetin dioxygenase-like cupin family protein
MIANVQAITHPKLPGVSIFPLGGEVRKGEPQTVMVVMESGVEIPLHRHHVDATMTVVAGQATVFSEDNDNGREVGVGQYVRFAAHGAHGFQAGPDGFTFVSTNGGIVDTGEDWDIQFS